MSSVRGRLSGCVVTLYPIGRDRENGSTDRGQNGTLAEETNLALGKGEEHGGRWRCFITCSVFQESKQVIELL